MGEACAVRKMGKKCFLNEGYFSGKSLKLMLPDALSLAQNAFGGWALPGSAGKLTALSRPPSWFQGVLRLRGRRGNGPSFVSRFGGI